MPPIVTQLLVKRKTHRPLRPDWINTPPAVDSPEYYNKDVAGFLVFLAVVFTVVMISLYV